MKKILSVLLFLFCAITFAQQELNNYKYIIVPVHFEAFKSPNQYNTSTLIKYLLTEKGMNVVYNDKLPQILNSNRCLALTVELKDNSNMFTTKAALVFKDCNSNTIYSTKEGKSKIKEVQASFSEAINDAASSLSGYNYVYNEAANEPITISFKNDVQKLPEVKTKELVAEKEIIEIQEPIITESSQVKNVITTVEQESTVAGLYAQNISNGYQLVDSTPKIVMKIYKTSQPNVFIGENENGVSGLVYSINGAWYFEYYSGDVSKSESLNVKF